MCAARSGARASLPPAEVVRSVRREVLAALVANPRSWLELRERLGIRADDRSRSTALRLALDELLTGGVVRKVDDYYIIAAEVTPLPESRQEGEDA